MDPLAIDGDKIHFIKGSVLATATRQIGISDTGSPQIEDTYSFRWQSRRWVELLSTTGTAAASGASDYESGTLDIWMFDEIVVEFELDTANDMDLGIRFRDLDDGANINVVNVRDPDTAAVLDYTAVFQETARDASAATTYIWYCLDQNFPAKYKIRVYVENDDAVNDGGYTVKVYGRVLEP